jgi:hypothetical protein
VKAPATSRPAPKMQAPALTRAAVASRCRRGVVRPEIKAEPRLSFGGLKTVVNIGRWHLQQAPPEEARHWSSFRPENWIKLLTHAVGAAGLARSYEPLTRLSADSQGGLVLCSRMTEAGYALRTLHTGLPACTATRG